MRRERIARVALRAYPRESQEARGEEMLGTLRDVSGRSLSAFTREVGSLVLGGWRERATLTARVPTGRLIADACCQAMTIWLLAILVSVVSLEASRHWVSLPSPGLFGLLGLALLCALVGLDRIVGVCGVCVAAGEVLVINAHGQFRWISVAAMAVPLVCFTVMVVAPRARPRSARRLSWLAPTIVLAVILPYNPASTALVFVAAVSFIAVTRLLADPRLAVACGLMWASLAITDAISALIFTGTGPPWILTVSAALAMLTIAATRLRNFRRSTRMPL